MKTWLLLLFVFFSSDCFAQKLDEYKKDIKNKNLRMFYDNQLLRSKIANEETVEALLEGGQALADLKQKRKVFRDQQKLKESEIDAATTKEQVDAILGTLKYE